MKKYSTEFIIETARKYQSVNDWRNKDNSTYQAAKGYKILGLCTEHMTNLRCVKKYSHEDIIKIAKKYKSSTEWRKSSDHQRYKVAVNYGILAQCTAHMPRKAGIYSGIYQVYAYKFPGNVAYIGLTCVPERRHECHMRGGRVLRMATQIGVPVPDYLSPSSFGSLEIIETKNNEFIGQQINYKNLQQTQMMSIDEMKLTRVDLIKIDIEGMEIQALNGAKDTIRTAKPHLIIEKIKSNESEINEFLTNYGYKIFPLGMNILGVHESEPLSSQIAIEKNQNI